MAKKSYFGSEALRIAREGSPSEIEQLLSDLEASGDIYPDEDIINYPPEEDLIQIDGPDSEDYEWRADPDGEEDYSFWD